MASSAFLSLLRAEDPLAFLQVTGDWKGLLRMHFLHAANSSGLLSALSRPRTREELLADLGVERPELLDALLEVGLSLGEVAHTEGHYRLRGRRARALLKDDALAALVEANVTYYNAAFRGLSQRLKGGDLSEGVDGIGPLVARVSKIAEPHIRRFLEKAVKGRGPLRVLDVGCGSGMHLRIVSEANRELRGVGLDVDGDVAQLARENLAAWGLQDRVQVWIGDVRTWPEPIRGPFDLALLISVIYYFPEEERVGILRSVRELLGSEGTLALVTSCRGPESDPFSANLNLATSSMRGLSPLPEPGEMEAQLREAGFQNVRREALISRTTYFSFLAS